MTGKQLSLPPEVCRRVVQWAHARDLPALSHTSRVMQHAAEARIYETIELFHSPVAHRMCLLLSACKRVAAHVRNFILASDLGVPRQGQSYGRRATQPWAVREYWDAVHAALASMPALDYLYMTDPTFTNAWVLAPQELRFRLTEARLYLAWDTHMAAFISGQPKITNLFVAEVAEDVPRAPVAQDALPLLQYFEGPLILLDQLFNCPLTHLKVPIEHEDAQSLLPLVLPELCRFKLLRSLSVASIPEEISIECMLSISASCPQLQHLSHVPLPCEHKPRLKLMQCLTRMGSLTSLELDVSHWSPRPLGSFQRMFALEIRIYCPSLRFIVFWGGTDRWIWQWEPEPAPGSGTDSDEGGVDAWRSTWSQPHYPSHSSIWRSV